MKQEYAIKVGKIKQSKKPEVEGFDFQGRTNTQSLKKPRNEGTPFTLQTARPASGSDERVNWRSRLQLET